MDFQPRRLGDGADQGDGRPLAVGARHMDYRRKLVLRIAKGRAQHAHSFQRKVDPLGVARA